MGLATATTSEGKIFHYFNHSKFLIETYEGKGSGYYQKRNFDFLKRLIRCPDVILDIGANIGQNTVYYSDLATKVHAYEPVPQFFDVLSMNVAANSCSSVVLHQVGIGDTTHMSRLKIMKKNIGHSRILADREKESDQEITIETIALDDDPIVGNIDFIKMDIEGYEVYALRGMQSLLAAHRPILQIECMESNLSVHDFTTQDIITFLSSFGYVPVFPPRLGSPKKGIKIVLSVYENKRRPSSDIFFIPADFENIEDHVD